MGARGASRSPARSTPAQSRPRRPRPRAAAGACPLFRTDLARIAGPFDDSPYLWWDDADWCFRIRDAGGEVVFVPEGTVVHSYRRATRERPLSLASLWQLAAFVHFQRRWWGRRRELIALASELDRTA